MKEIEIKKRNYKEIITNYMEDVIICPISGLESQLIKNRYDRKRKTTVLEFKNYALRKIEMQKSVYLKLLSIVDYSNLKYIYAGIIRQYNDNHDKPFFVDEQFINEGYKEFEYPKDFHQKAFHLLKYLYYNGGREYHSFEFESENDYPLAFATDPYEFNRILQMLKDQKLIKITKGILHIGYNYSITFSLIQKAYKKLEEDLGISQLFKFVDENVFTGNKLIDKKIIHAKNLYHRSTIEDKRSACKVLGDILEPIREDLKNIYWNDDESFFFLLLNKFDIRHNNKDIKELKHEEQLDWIFFNFLNSINTYYRIMKKIKDKNFEKSNVIK